MQIVWVRIEKKNFFTLYVDEYWENIKIKMTLSHPVVVIFLMHNGVKNSFLFDIRLCDRNIYFKAVICHALVAHTYNPSYSGDRWIGFGSQPSK
jgi:hypothetical protein